MPGARFLAVAMALPGVVVMIFDRRRDPKKVADDVRKVAREKGDKAKVNAHSNGAVSLVVET